VRKFAFSYPLLFLAIWTGVLFTGDYVVLETSVHQFLADKYAMTVGEIVRSELGQGTLGRRGINIGYSYNANGVDYTGRLYRYDERNGAFDYKLVAKAFPPGSRQIVYYNPDNPADAVLSPGLSGCDLLLALFALPLNVISIAVWVAMIQSRRDCGRLPAGGVRILHPAGETRVRLAEFSPLAAGFFVLAAAAIAAAMLIVFAAGFGASLELMKATLIVVAATGVAAFAWTAERNRSGRYDLCAYEAGQTLLIPPAAGRKAPLIVPKSEIIAVTTHRRVSHNPSGWHFSFVPALDRAAPSSERQSLDLVNWGWTEGKARAFAGWLSQELGVPLKEPEEEIK
jgi:hypothetical protein